MKTKNYIPVYEPYISANQRNYVLDALDSNWISSKGKYVDQFEDSFKQYIDIKHAISCSNGTVALHLSLLALSIKKGDEILVPSFTYIASVNCIAYCQARPVFVDSDAQTLQIDLDDVKRKLTARTKAIIVPHLYGYCGEIEEIKKFCDENAVFLIEDCAESLGTEINGKKLGSFGDIATFSFFGNKTVTTGEGGMVVTNNDKLADLVFRYKTQGLEKNKEYMHDIVGYNYRMTNIQAAIGCAQLEEISEILKNKTRVFNKYFEHLNDLDIAFPVELKGLKCSYWMVTLIFRNEETKDKVRSKLKLEGIETRPAFPLVHTMKAYRNIGRVDNLTIERISKAAINVPSYPALRDEDIENICLLIKQSLT